MNFLIKCVFVLFSLIVSFSAFGGDVYDHRIPDEYETTGGNSLAFSNSSVSSSESIAAVRQNPALLSLNRTYDVGGGYDWPTVGREFYNAGVIDSKTSSVAAGFIYQSFPEKFLKNEFKNFKPDSPVKRRFILGLGQSLETFSVGINVQYVEAFELDTSSEKSEEKIKGIGFGFGAAGIFSQQLRWGLSVENLANKKISQSAPKTIRGGLTYFVGAGNIFGSLDFRRRDRVRGIEYDYQPEQSNLSTEQTEKLIKEDEEYEKPENMVFLALNARVYDVVRLTASYGQSISGPERQTLSGGAGIVHGNTSLFYSVSRPYLSEKAAHQSVGLSFAVSL